MADRSAIEWTEATWNPTTGCDRISTGCDNCYALLLAGRLKAMGVAKYQVDGDPRTSGPGFGVTCHVGELETPKRWRKPRVVFVNSMSDLFHPAVPDDFIDLVWRTMAQTPRHTYQILTKRPQRMASLLGRWDREGRAPTLPNVWLGTTIESDSYVFRADYLRRTPASVRFLSLEPLLGSLSSLSLAQIDWVIAGGESGPKARPLDGDAVRNLRDRCSDEGVPFFFKQWGGRTPKSGGRALDGRTWDQLPKAARVLVS